MTNNHDFLSPVQSQQRTLITYDFESQERSFGKEEFFPLSLFGIEHVRMPQSPIFVFMKRLFIILFIFWTKSPILVDFGKAFKLRLPEEYGSQ